MAFSARFIVLAAAAASAYGIVTGIDFGNEFFKVSLVKPGQSFQIATNVASKRKTASMISFYSGDRLFGSDAESLTARKPRVTVTNPQRLLGRNASHPASVHYAGLEGSPYGRSYYGAALGTNTRGGCDVLMPEEETGAVPHLEVEGAAEGTSTPAEGSASSGLTVFSTEELAAQILEHAREFTEAFADGVKVRDAVITVPAYYTQFERISLLDAAELAGYRVSALLDENTGAGIHYGIDRVQENGTHYMMLYNMGAEATQVTLFAYDSYALPEKASSLPPSKDAPKPKLVGQGRVVAKAWDNKLGGRAFDAALIELAADRFNAQKGSILPASARGDVRNVASSMAKMRKNVIKAKEVLSANEEFGLTVESIYGENVDFRMQLSRAVLDEAGAKAKLWERVTAVVDACIAQTNGTVPLSAVHVVEVVGGAVRMPRVQTLLREHLAKAAAVAAASPSSLPGASTGPTLGVHMNGDEAMALGAAFAAANKSAAFRVRKVGMMDAFPFPIGVRLSHLDPTLSASAGAIDTSAGGEEVSAAEAEGAPDAAGATAKSGKPWHKRSSLFRPYNHLDSVKRISFTADRDLRASLFYETVTCTTSPQLPEGTPRLLGVYNVTGLTALSADNATAALGPMKVHISFELDVHGIARVLKAEATQEEEVLVPEPTPTPTPTPTPKAKAGKSSKEGLNATASAEEEGAPAGEEDNATASASPSADASASASPSADASASASAEPTSVGPPKMKTVKKTHRHTLAVALDASASGFPVQPMSAADKAAASQRLRKLRANDEAKRALESAKNALEGYIYASREKIDGAGDEWSVVATESQRDAITEVLRLEEDWLLEDGQADMEGYKTRLKTLKGAVEPAFERLRETRDREDNISRARSAVSAGQDIVSGWATTHPQINTNETLDAAEAVDALEAWLNTTVAAQEASPAHETPVLTGSDVTKRIRSLADLLTRLSRKPKPTPTPTPFSTLKKDKGQGKGGKSKAKSSGRASAGKEGEGENGPSEEEEEDSDAEGSSYSGSEAGEEEPAPGGEDEGEADEAGTAGAEQAEAEEEEIAHANKAEL